MIICKLYILKALQNTDSVFVYHLVVFPPSITLYLLVLKLYLLRILNYN